MSHNAVSFWQSLVLRCKFCGELKTFSEFWTCDFKTNTCKCNKCSEKGLWFSGRYKYKNKSKELI